MNTRPNISPRTDDRTLSLDAFLALLVEHGTLAEDDAARLKSGARPDDARHPALVIAELDRFDAGGERAPLTDEMLVRALAEIFELPYLRIDPLKIDVAAVTQVASQAYAKRFRFLPIAVTSSTVTCATAEPRMRSWCGELARILGKRVECVISNPRDIERYQREFYGVSRSILGAESSSASERLGLVENFEQLTDLGSAGEPDANDQHVVHLVDWLLQYAFDQRASDIHIEPRREKSNLKFRIDGQLHLVHEVPRGVTGAIVSRLKTLGRLDVADKRRPQDGRIKTRAPSGDEVEMRLSTMPTAFGEKLVMRIFDPDLLSRSFAELGFTRPDRTVWQRMVARPHGIVLVTGPTGSGKTTTLYSALKQLARPEINICTIEDPIEMVEPKFNQMQVQPALDLDFAAGVRTLLRQDPDIIMIGEIRDKATADVAVQAALTGHLVLSTLHTNDAPSAVTRMRDIGVPPYLIAATLIGVVAQRLVRTLCPTCKAPTEVDEIQWHALTTPYKAQVTRAAHRAVGCDDCRNTGYRGRIGIYEMLEISPELGDAIQADLGTSALRDLGLKHGMRPLRIAGAHQIAKGRTTFEEVFSVVPTQRAAGGS